MAAFNYSTQGTQEKKTAAKLEKLRKENPEEVENLLKTVQVPTTGPPNRSQWRKLELAMKFINKSKAEADGKGGGGGHHSPSKTSSSSRPGTPNRKSITSIDGKDHERLNRTLTKQATLVSLGKSGSAEGKIAAGCVTVVAAAASSDPGSPRGPVTCSKTTSTTTTTSTTAGASSKPSDSTTTTATTATKTTQAKDSSCSSNATTSTTTTSSSSSSSPRPNTSSVETNTDLSNKKISEVQTDDNAKVLLSKKTQTDITSLSTESELVTEVSKTAPSPKNKKKPLKKQKSLSKITNSFGKIV